MYADRVPGQALSMIKNVLSSRDGRESNGARICMHFSPRKFADERPKVRLLYSVDEDW
jgi:hypothetical protein